MLVRRPQGLEELPASGVRYKQDTMTDDTIIVIIYDEKHTMMIGKKERRCQVSDRKIDLIIF